MVVQDLIQQIDYSLVSDVIMKLYPNEKKRMEEGCYQYLWDELTRTSPAENRNHTTIHVQYIKEHEKSERYMWHVTYSMDRRYHHQYDLQFLSKAQILSAMIFESDLAFLSKEEYLAHLLFDLAREGQMEDMDDGLQCVEPKAHLPHFAEKPVG